MEHLNDSRRTRSADAANSAITPPTGVTTVGELRGQQIMSPANSAIAPHTGVTPPRIGLLGGTFDPPHYGHLILAQEAALRLALAQVIFLPARQNPLKRHEQVSSAADRCEMVQHAISDNPLFQVSRADLDRPPPSYTVDLLRLLHQGCAPDTAFFFLVGADILAELPAWYQPEEVIRLATLVVVNRPGWESLDLPALEQRLPGLRQRLREVTIPGIDISSKQIRQRVHAGHPIRYLVPPAVETYIQHHHLYRP